MAQGRVDGSVIIDTKIDNAQYQKGIEAMKKSTVDFSKSASQSFKAVDVSLTNLAATALAVVGSFKTLSSISSAIDLGIGYNKQLESAQLGIASILASTHDLVDAQGRMLEGQEKFNAAQKMSVQMAKALDVASMQSTAEYTDLLSAFQTILAPAAQLQLTWQESLDVTVQMSNVLASMNIPMERLAQETQRILTGNDLINSQVAKRLGITKEEIKTWGTGAKLLESFQKRFEAMGYAGAAAEKTLEAVQAYYSDTMASLAAEATKGYFESMKESMLAVADAFYEIDDASKTFKITDEMKPLVDLARDIVSAFGEAGETITKSFVDKLRTASGFIERNRDSIDALGSAIGTVSSNFHVGAAALAGYIAAQKLADSTTLKYLGTQAKLQIQQARGQATILGSAQATLQQAKAQEAAALASLNETKAQIASVQASQAKALASTNATQAAFARLAVEKQLSALSAKLTIDETRYASAVNATTVASQRASIAGRALAAVRVGFSGLIRMLSSWTTIITAGAALWMYFGTKQSEAQKINEQYSASIAGLTGNAEEAANAVSELEKRISSMSAEQAGFELQNVEKSLAKIRSEFNSLKTEMTRSALTLALPGEMDPKGPFAELIDQLLAGDIAAEEFRKSVYAIGQTLDEADKKQVDSAISLVNAYELQIQMRELLNKAIGRGAQESEVTAQAAEKAAKSLMDLKQAEKAVSELADAFDRFTLSAESLSAKQLDKNINDYRNAIASLAAEGKMAEASIASVQLAILQAGAKAGGFDSLKAFVAEREKLSEQLKRLELGDVEFEKQAAQAKYDAIQAGLAAAADAAKVEVAILESRMEMSHKFTDAQIENLKIQLEAAQQSVAQLEALQARLKGRSALDLFGGSKGSKSGRSAADVIKEIRQQIAELNAVDTTSFGAGLRKGLEGIEEKAAGVRLAADAVKALKREFSEAYAGNFLREVTKEIRELTGRGALDALQSKVAEVVAAINAFGDDSAAAADLIRKLDEEAGKAALSVEEQAKAIDDMAEALIKANPELEKHIRLLAQRQKDQLNKDNKEDPQTWADGWKKSADAFVDEWTNSAKVAEKVFDGLMSSVQAFGSNVVDAIFGDAELRAEDLFKSIAKMMMQIAMNQMIANIFGSFGFGSAKTQHTGGIVGVPDANPARRVNPAIFADAPRYHSGGIAGLASNEVATILTRGEGVFTPAQMKAIGAGFSAPPTVNFEIIDQRSANAPPVETQSSTDANGMTQIRAIIKETVAGDISSGGSVGRSIQSTYGLKRSKFGS